MPERFTQRQIDSLWQTLDPATGDVSANQLLRYDFRGGAGILPTGNTLNVEHERLATCWSDHLAQSLRLDVRAVPHLLEPMRAPDLLDAVLLSTVLAVFCIRSQSQPEPTRAGTGSERPEKAPPDRADRRLLLAIPPVLLSLMVDRLLGGSGIGNTHLTEPTPLEMAIVRPILNGLLGDVLSTFKPGVPLTAELASLTTDPRLVEALAPELVILTTEFQVLDCVALVHLALPVHWVVAGPGLPTKPPPGDPAAPRLQPWLDTLPVGLRLSLSQVDLSVEELLQLQVGDVLTFPTAVSDHMTLWIEEQPAFHVRSGRRGRNLAAQIIECIDPTLEEPDP